jgi:membrane protease YdiL (CAAX protease family)
MDHELFIVDNFDLLFIIYLPIVFLQEFLSRGVIQTAIASVLDERNANFWAIITASALFGLVHIQLSVFVAFASFACGLY